METVIKKIQENVEKSYLRLYSLLFSFMALVAINSMAQSDAKTINDIKDSAAQVALEAQKSLQHETFMNYLYMAIGFCLIIGVAWFSGMKRKKGGNNTNQSSHIIKHNHRTNHSSYDKRYGSSRSRG